MDREREQDLFYQSQRNPADRVSEVNSVDQSATFPHGILRVTEGVSDPKYGKDSQVNGRNKKK